MNFNIDIIKSQLPRYKKLLERYAVFIFLITFLGIYIFLVQQIGKLINSEPSPQTVTETSTKPISRLKIDKNAVSQMEQLENQNIQVQTLFSEARQNPFAE